MHRKAGNEMYEKFVRTYFADRYFNDSEHELSEESDDEEEVERMQSPT